MHHFTSSTFSFGYHVLRAGVSRKTKLNLAGLNSPFFPIGFAHAVPPPPPPPRLLKKKANRVWQQCVGGKAI